MQEERQMKYEGGGDRWEDVIGRPGEGEMKERRGWRSGRRGRRGG